MARNNYLYQRDIDRAVRELEEKFDRDWEDFNDIERDELLDTIQEIDTKWDIAQQDYEDSRREER